ncbi:MAG: metallophosphoesterase family protein [Planctomycetota bacterium]|nr:metallophosphoesterase family protein [Planctomycetota bacterium]
MYAVISDIHSNLEALTAVLADLDALGVRDVRCLGDVVGYGPSPLECVDLVQHRAQVVVRGNHDEALVHGAYGFHLRAKDALDWTRDQLRPGFMSGQAVRRRWDWLTTLPLRHEDGPDVFVHGSPRDPTQEYLMAAEAAYGPSEKFEEVFAAFDRLLFVGHTHHPGVITSDYEGRTPAQLGGALRVDDLAGRKAIVNVGSVGQPRDGDPRACYVLVDGDVIRWRRVANAADRPAARVRATPRLHPSLGERLLVGA